MLFKEAQQSLIIVAGMYSAFFGYTVIDCAGEEYDLPSYNNFILDYQEITCYEPEIVNDMMTGEFRLLKQGEAFELLKQNQEIFCLENTVLGEITFLKKH